MKKKSSKKKKWDSYASKAVSSLRKQRKERLGAHKANEPWQSGLPHYGSGGGKGK